MTNPTVRIHDLSTGEVIDREMTKDELAAWNSQVAKYAEEAAKAEAEVATKAALLERLGITAEEAALLLK